MQNPRVRYKELYTRLKCWNSGKEAGARMRGMEQNERDVGSNE